MEPQIPVVINEILPIFKAKMGKMGEWTTRTVVRCACETDVLTVVRENSWSLLEDAYAE